LFTIKPVAIPRRWKYRSHTLQKMRKRANMYQTSDVGISYVSIWLASFSVNLLLKTLSKIYD